MGKIRSIHPDACESHTLAGLSDGAERTWWRLLPNTDDHGRGRYDPVTLRSKLYMANPDVTVERVAADMDELHRAGLIVAYRHDGRLYYLVRSFDEYQKPRHQAESRHPDPNDPKSETVAPDSVLVDGNAPSVDRNPESIERPERERELERELERESSLSDPASGSGQERQPAETDADDADGDNQRITESFEQFWQAYPRRHGKKEGKGNALLEWRKLTWEQRRRAYLGAVNLAASEQMPKNAERFLRRAKGGKGDFPFDDWQEPAQPQSNGSPPSHSRGADYAARYEAAAAQARSKGR